MISVIILGSGNVATHLIHAFLKIDSIHLKQVYTRNLRDTKYRIYKWKPASKNSLDFYVEYERHKETKQILNVYDDSKSFESSLETENMSLDKLENIHDIHKMFFFNSIRIKHLL